MRVSSRTAHVQRIDRGANGRRSKAGRDGIARRTRCDGLHYASSHFRFSGCVFISTGICAVSDRSDGSAIIGVLGLLLASVGIYGMVSFAVSQRTHEVGVRMALGARGGDVLGLVLREAMRPVVIGVVVGLAAAAGVSQILVAFLFGLSTLDPVTFVSVAALLIAVALLAGYVPARRATKVDPMVALRYE